MRALADGRVRWGFWPPGATPVRDGEGVCLGEWSGDATSDDEDSDSELDVSGKEEASSPRSKTEDEEDEESDVDESQFAKANNASFFAALSLGDDNNDSDEDVAE